MLICEKYLDNQFVQVTTLTLPIDIPSECRAITI